MRIAQLRLAGFVLACGLAVLQVPSCSGSHHPASARPAAGPSLPPGFTAPGTPHPARIPVLLSAAPVQHERIAALQRAPLPVNQAAQEAQAIISQPVSTLIHPILVSSQELRPGETLTVVAAQLPSRQAVHGALLILQGEGYQGERLLQVRLGTAAAVITLPHTMEAGTWTLAVEDLSGITTSTHDQVSGQAVLDLGIFQVTG
jgi:hypothetical protein